MTSPRCPSAFAALVLTMALVRAPEVAAQAENVTRIYDLRALTVQRLDEFGPRLGFDELTDQRGQFFDNDHEISPEAITTLIQDGVDPGSWESERRLSLRDGTLVVSAPPEAQAKIAAILAWIRAKQSGLLALEVRVYAGPATAADEILGGGSVLDSARIAALARPPWRRVSASRLAAYSGQRNHATSTTEAAYVGTYGLEVAGEAHGWAPVIRTVTAGEVADATAVIADSGSGVLAEFRHETCTADWPLPTFDLGLRTMSGKPLPPLEIPRTRTWRLRNALWIPAGGQAIAGAYRAGDELRVVVVRHLNRPIALPALPPGDGKRSSRLYDTRYIVFESPDFVPPRLGISPSPRTSSGGVGGAIFDSGDEGARITIDALIEMIKAAIDPYSWEDERSQIARVGGQLFVNQTTEVHAQIEAYLAQLAHVRDISLFVRAQVLEAADEPTAHELLDLVGEALTPAARTALLERIAAGHGIAVVADSGTAALPGQKVYAATYASEAFVRDHSVSMAKRTAQFDPEVGSLRHGTTLSVRPTLIQAGRQVSLELGLADARLEGTPTRDAGDGLKLAAPALELGMRRLRVVLTEGGSTLVDLGRRRFARIEIHASRPEKRGEDK